MIPLLTTGVEFRIAAAIARVYRDAGLDADALRAGVVPLYSLIGAYPLRVVEVVSLTYGSAREFLQKESRQQVPVPEQPDRPLAGFLYIYGYRDQFYGCILVKKDGQTVARRRFSAAHELGHYLLHFLPRLEETAGSGTAPWMISEGLDLPGEDEPEPPSGQLFFSGGERWSGKRTSSPPSS
jgi:hypothetical protein